jgi:hypothetical protein
MSSKGTPPPPSPFQPHLMILSEAAPTPNYFELHAVGQLEYARDVGMAVAVHCIANPHPSPSLSCSGVARSITRITCTASKFLAAASVQRSRADARINVNINVVTPLFFHFFVLTLLPISFDLLRRYHFTKGADWSCVGNCAEEGLTQVTSAPMSATSEILRTRRLLAPPIRASSPSPRPRCCRVMTSRPRCSRVMTSCCRCLRPPTAATTTSFGISP